MRLEQVAEQAAERYRDRADRSRSCRAASSDEKRADERADHPADRLFGLKGVNVRRAQRMRRSPFPEIRA